MPRWTAKIPTQVIALFVLIMAFMSYLSRITNPGPLDQQIEKLVASYAEDNGFSGVVLAVLGSDTLLHQAYGMADYNARRPNTVQTRFPAADISQLMLRSVAALLCAHGRLDPDSAITELKGLRLPHAMTLRQMLTHHTGLADVYGQDSRLALPLRQQRHISSTGLLERILAVPPSGPSGGGRLYTMGNGVLAGALLEENIGMSLQQWLAECLFTPLNMTGASLADTLTGIDMAGGWRRDQKQWLPVVPVHLSHYRYAGDLCCTAEDLLRWTAVRDSLAGRPDCQSLLGRLDHFGRLPGYRSALLCWPHYDLTVVILSNMDDANVEDMAAQITTLMLRPVLKGVSADTTAWKRYTGVYEARPYNLAPVRWVVHPRGRELVMTMAASDDSTVTVELKPETSSRFLTGLYGLLLNVSAEFKADSCQLDISGWQVDGVRVGDYTPDAP